MVSPRWKLTIRILCALHHFISLVVQSTYMRSTMNTKFIWHTYTHWIFDINMVICECSVYTGFDDELFELNFFPIQHHNDVQNKLTTYRGSYLILVTILTEIDFNWFIQSFDEILDLLIVCLFVTESIQLDDILWYHLWSLNICITDEWYPLTLNVSDLNGFFSIITWKQNQVALTRTQPNS